jgi:hypothetical protein
MNNMKEKLKKIGKFVFNNKDVIISKAKDEVIDVATSSAKNFVWRYIILSNIIVAIVNLSIGIFIGYSFT